MMRDPEAALGEQAASSLLDSDPPRTPPVVALPAAHPRMAHALLAVAAAASAAGAVLLATLQGLPGATGSAVAFALVALVAALSLRAPRRWHTALATAVSVAVVAAIAGHAIALGWGAEAPSLPLLGLLVCVLCPAAGVRPGAVLALLSALAVGAVALFGPAPGPGAPPLLLLAGTQLIAVAAGLAGGGLLSRAIARARRDARDREQRFSRLLGLAADAYWEIDAQYRLVAASASGERYDQPMSSQGAIGAVPWELPQFGCDHDTLDRLLADVDDRQPFRDLPVRWSDEEGRQRSYLVSGEPRFDDRGVFRGYWGVARDVTDVASTREALAATETRYQELFSRIPTPLVLHRAGIVIDANPAALALFGHDDLGEMVGTDLLAAYEGGDSRERARRRMELLQGQPMGTALPVTDFRLQVDGRRISVRATGVRVDAAGGPALLSIFVDDTERLAAEDAVRRSEAMLSHLVATSPDLITLTDMATGRYAMVNQTFERITGWTAVEAVGRTSLELGVWGNETERGKFLATLREHGAVADLPVDFVVKSGQRIRLLVSAAPFEMDRREYLVINARDVTETERSRLEREAILANASIGIAVTRDRAFVLANRHFEHMFGWADGTLTGQPGRVVWASDAAYREVGQSVGPRLARGETVESEHRMARRDGSTFLARVRASPIDPARPQAGGTVWIVEDITERRQFEQALARARDDAEAASRAKSAFLANTSHELRTPLNGMIGLARLARDPDTAEDERRRYLEQIADSAQSLAGIISDILDLSKIEAGKLQIETTAFDLGALLRALQQTYATLASARGLALRFEIAPGADGRVLGDELRVRQILTNFLSNALKFTEQGSITVRADRLHGADAEARVMFEVADTGPGIDPVTRERLFRPFTQADESTTRRYGGTGLGLSICSELAELMGGEVGVASEPGQGSRFWAELPLPPTDTPAPAPAAGVAQSLQGARVLMVEDNPVNMMVAVATLERWGVQVAQATDGRQAVDAVQAAAAAGQPFDAVLMDVQMPVMSGHEATRTLRASDAGRELPIVALTAAALVSEREEAMRAGMNDFLTKPINEPELRSALLRWCTRLRGAAD